MGWFEKLVSSLSLHSIARGDTTMGAASLENHSAPHAHSLEAAAKTRHASELHVPTGNRLTAEGAGARGLEDRALGLVGRARQAVGQRELDLRVVELVRAGLLGVLGSQDGRAHDLDRARAGTVATSKLGVELLDGAAERDVAVLLVHVVGAAARVVADPDAVVLDDAAVLLRQL